jgi:UDPglucose 6-dehydrogenase
MTAAPSIRIARRIVEDEPGSAEPVVSAGPSLSEPSAPANEFRYGPQRITVIGCGHVGLIVSVGLAELGHDVVGLDVSDDLVARLRRAEPQIEEPALGRYLQKGISSGRLTFTSRYEEAIPDAGFIFIAVDTPQTLAGAADLRNIRAAMRSVVENLNGTSPVIVNKSTSPIGTGETIENLVSEALSSGGRLPRIVSNPEFLQQGQALEDFFTPNRIVVGSRSSEDAERVADLYAPLRAPVLLTDLRTAEMIKYVANSFLATRISFINEVARLCEELGIDIDPVVAGISKDERIGSHFFRPGIGFGGSCLPKDVAALRYIGDTLGVATPVLSAVQQVNANQRTSAVRRLRARLGSLEGKRIGVWGLTFKGGTEDTRDSPAMDVVSLLVNEGAIVHAYDPSVSADPGQAPAWLQPLIGATALDVADDADALAILTDWPEFASLPLKTVRARMRGSVLFDGRNVLTKDAAEAGGFAYHGVGRVGTLSRRRATDS